jgi:small conductance mechanosensitive channel
MHELKTGEADVFAYLRPDSLIGAAVYLLVFVLAALLLARALRAAMSTVMARQGHIDRTTMSFLQQVGTAAIWVIMLILYAHLIPVLRAMGTALLAGASIASVVIGLAAQSTLGNLIAGVAITLYRPFRLGDTLQVSSPTGTEVGTVELISLGYTTLRTADGRCVVLPNSVASSQVTINLGAASTSAPLPIVIGIGRDTDVETARGVALTTARELLGEAGVLGCFLTRVDPNGAAFELRVRVLDPGERDALRSQLVAALARRFTDSGLDPRDGPRASFS